VATSAEPNRDEHRGAYTNAIYGVISIAVVVVTWEADGNEWHLVEVIAGYIVSLWTLHSYAALGATGQLRPWWHVAREEFPVAAAGLPALGVAVVGLILGWSEPTEAALALTACALTLVALQTSVLRRIGASRRRIARTVGVDMVIAAIILCLYIAI